MDQICFKQIIHVWSHVVVSWMVLEATQRSDYFGNKNFMRPIRALNLKVVQQV